MDLVLHRVQCQQQHHDMASRVNAGHPLHPTPTFGHRPADAMQELSVDRYVAPVAFFEKQRGHYLDKDGVGHRQGRVGVAPRAGRLGVCPCRQRRPSSCNTNVDQHYQCCRTFHVDRGRLVFRRGGLHSGSGPCAQTSTGRSIDRSVKRLF